MIKKERCLRNHEPNFRYTPGHKTCRECDRERTLKRWRESPDRRIYQYYYAKNYYQRQREMINREKSKPCMDCGIQYNPWIMQFDHRNPLDKSFTVGTSGYKTTSKRILEEISKCDVVCSNCHCERTHKNEALIKRLRAEGRKRVKQSS